jgi:hypothetical protein
MDNIKLKELDKLQTFFNHIAALVDKDDDPLSSMEDVENYVFMFRVWANGDVDDNST